MALTRVANSAKISPVELRQFIQYAGLTLPEMFADAKSIENGHFMHMAEIGKILFNNMGFIDDSGQPGQPATGIPYMTKASLPKAGWGSSLGLPIALLNQTTTSPAVSLMDNHFALIGVARTVGLGLHSHDPEVENAHNPEFICGASSSGPGAAVASGTVPVATGTSIGGSLEFPAAYQGLTVVRPSASFALEMPRFVEGEKLTEEEREKLQHQAVSAPPAYGFHRTGVLARDVDSAIMCQGVLRGEEPIEYLAKIHGTPVKPMVIGVTDCVPFSGDEATPDKDQLDSIMEHGAQLRKAGVPFEFVRVDPLRFPQEDLCRGFVSVFAPYIAEKTTALEAMPQLDGVDLYSDSLGPFRKLFKTIGEHITPEEGQKYVEIFTRLRQEHTRWLQENGLDCVITPTIRQLRTRDELVPTDAKNAEYEALIMNPQQNLEAMIRAATESYQRELGGANVTYGNAIGCPTMVTPDPQVRREGLLGSMQVIGAAGQEELIMQLVSTMSRTLELAEEVSAFHEASLLARLTRCAEQQREGWIR